MILDQLRQWARQLKIEVYALYLACRDARVPWYARVVAACVVGYALSPIDLIPDPIPILGYLDDLILVPLGIALALRLIPPALMDECRAQARVRVDRNLPSNWLAAGIILATWALLALGALLLIRRAWD